MEFFSSTFFCSKGDPPKASLGIVKGKEKDDPWPIYLIFSGTELQQGNVTIHLHNESDFIQFKNSVIEAYDKYRRLRGYDR